MSAIVINAISVREGGSLVVLRELLAGMSALRPQWRWQVVVNSQAPALPELPSVEYLHFPKLDQSGWRTRLWYETGLPALLKLANADVLFSMTNYLPLRRMPCPALLLVQHAGHFSPIFRQLTEVRLGPVGRLSWRMKGQWVKSSVRAADAVTVQTNALARQLAHDAHIPRDRIRVVPHGIGLAELQQSQVLPPVPGATFRVGYITKRGVQKNFSVIFEAVARLTKRGIPLRLALTLSEAEPQNRTVLELARNLGVEAIIENYGELSPTEIDRLYKSLHAFVFPSLCESFGFPMVEAMAHGIPLLVADTESNVEVVGEGGKAFPAHDAESLARELERLSNDVDWFRLRAQASLQRVREFDWVRAAAETVSLIDELAPGLRSDLVVTEPLEGRYS